MFPSIFKKAVTKLRELFKKLAFKPTIPRSQAYELEAQDVPADPDRIRPTKAYADQRQKAPRNRKHKPSKAMKSLYQLQ